MLTEKEKTFLQKQAKGQKWRLIAGIAFLIVAILDYKVRYLYSFFGNFGLIITGFYAGLSFMYFSHYFIVKEYLSIHK